MHSLHSQDSTSANFLFYLTLLKIVYIKYKILFSDKILHFRDIEMAEGILSRKAGLPWKKTTKKRGKQRLLQCCHLLPEGERAALSNYQPLSAFQCLIIAQSRSIKLYHWEQGDL